MNNDNNIIENALANIFILIIKLCDIIVAFWLFLFFKCLKMSDRYNDIRFALGIWGSTVLIGEPFFITIAILIAIVRSVSYAFAVFKFGSFCILCSLLALIIINVLFNLGDDISKFISHIIRNKLN